MRNFVSRLALTLLFAASLPAGAAFHLFAITEVYTNNSGTVQYVELTALSGGQQFTSGHTLSITGGGNTVVCNSSPDLPGNTSGGKKMLFGTAGLQARFGVTPDYICPNLFVAPLGGTINWGEGSAVLTYPALPADGATSLNGTNLVPGTATPQNFAGVIGTLQPQVSPAYQGMWWAGDAESGWGINTAHQGDILFATWFTYAADSTGLWMILSNGAKIADGQYRGDIFTVRGPPFNSVPFDPTAAVATNVGNGTFTFTSPTTGSFQYTVNGIAQTKQISRFEYAPGVPTCTAGGTPTGLNYQDIWWKSPGGSESGWGLNVVHQGNILFLTWFTYDATGKGQWLVMPNVSRTTGESFTGTIFRSTGNPFNSTPWNKNSVVSTPVGTATVSFTDRANGTFTYTLDGISQSKAITRTVYNPNGTQTVCNAP